MRGKEIPDKGLCYRAAQFWEDVGGGSLAGKEGGTHGIKTPRRTEWVGMCGLGYTTQRAMGRHACVGVGYVLGYG